MKNNFLSKGKDYYEFAGANRFFKELRYNNTGGLKCGESFFVSLQYSF